MSEHVDVSKCTRGPYHLEIHPRRTLLYGDETDNGVDYFAEFDDACQHMEANSQLALEAFAVAHEMGLSPRQLADRVSALEDGLKRCMAALLGIHRGLEKDHFPGTRNLLEAALEYGEASLRGNQDEDREGQ